MGLQSQITALIKATEDKLEMKSTKQLESIVLNIETINQRLDSMVSGKDFEIVGQLKKDLEELNKNLKANQEVIDVSLKYTPSDCLTQSPSKPSLTNSFTVGLSEPLWLIVALYD